MLPTIYISKEVALPDNDKWQFRFEIRSQSSNRVSTIAQNRKGRFWGCSCPGWKTRRRCKHLTELGLPGDQKPYEVNLLTK
jgi:hypothetical protein